MKKQNTPPINLRDAFSPTPDMCRDAGSAALASCVEFAGCAVAVVLSLPLLMSVMELVASI